MKLGIGKKLIVTIIGTLLVMSNTSYAEEIKQPSNEIISIGIAPTLEDDIIFTPPLIDDQDKSYTDEDYEYLVMVLTGECQSFPVEIQKKYGSVVLNRVKSSRYPNTIKEVCLQRGQYASFRDGNAYRTPTENSKQAALWLLENGSIYPEKVIYQSMEKQGKGVYETYKGEYFCY